jgi:hypothetical protein
MLTFLALGCHMLNADENRPSSDALGQFLIFRGKGHVANHYQRCRDILVSVTRGILLLRSAFVHFRSLRPIAVQKRPCGRPLDGHEPARTCMNPR